MPKYNKVTVDSGGIEEEIKKVDRQISINRNDLISSIDRSFYDIENLEDQSKIFRIILDQSTLDTLKAIKKYVELSTNGKNKKEKIRFILSFTNDDLRPSHPYYKDQFKRYLKMDDQEIDFNYYHFKKEAKKYGL
mgnify:FL=1